MPEIVRPPAIHGIERKGFRWDFEFVSDFGFPFENLFEWGLTRACPIRVIFLNKCVKSGRGSAVSRRGISLKEIGIENSRKTACFVRTFLAFSERLFRFPTFPLRPPSFSPSPPPSVDRPTTTGCAPTRPTPPPTPGAQTPCFSAAGPGSRSS